MARKKGPKQCIEFKELFKILVFRSLTFKNCNFTTVKTRFLKLSCFGAKIVVAKTWGFKGAKIKSLEIRGAPSNPQRHQMGHQETPQKPPNRAQRGPQSTLEGIFTFEMVFYQKCTFSRCKSKVYESDGGQLERSKSTPRGSKIGKTTIWTQRAK